MCSLSSQCIQTTPEPIRMKLPGYPWSQIAIDFYGSLPSDEKLFVLMYMYSRYLIVVTNYNASAQSVIRKFNKIFSMFSYPKEALNDNGGHHFKVIY